MLQNSDAGGNGEPADLIVGETIYIELLPYRALVGEDGCPQNYLGVAGLTGCIHPNLGIVSAHIFREKYYGVNKTAASSQVMYTR